MFDWKGNKLCVSVFGASHAAEIGAEVTGLPAESFNERELLEFLARRRARKAAFSTSRVESDLPIFHSGAKDGKLDGTLLKVTLENKNVNSGDYAELYGKPRPSHADFAAYCKDGRLDFSGGGEFSGRMTAPLCVVGGIAKQLLAHRGVRVCAHISQIGNVCGLSYKDGATPENWDAETFPALSNAEEMQREIAACAAQGNSVGGVVECVVSGVPGGLGGALFQGLEGKISNLLFAVPAVKGVEFGLGFGLANLLGSQANDPLCWQDGKVVAKTNNSGGINGGISNGMPITLAVAFRPTPSIGLPQQTVDLVTKKDVEITVRGRHDACIVPRAVPVVEAMVAIAILDSVLDK